MVARPTSLCHYGIVRDGSLHVVSATRFLGKRSLFGLAILAAAAVIGFALGWGVKHGDAPAPSRPIGPDSHAPEPLDSDVPVATTLEDTLRLPGNFRQYAALYQLLASADIPTLDRLLSEAETLAGWHNATAARTVIYSRFVELDPERALADVLRRGGPEQERFVHAVLPAEAGGG